MSILEDFFLVINFVKVNLIIFSWCYQRFTRLVLSFYFFYLCFMELFQAETLRKDLIQRTFSYWNLPKLLSQLFWLNAFELRISKNGFCFSSYFRWSSWLVVCLNFLFSATNICLKFFLAKKKLSQVIFKTLN